MAKASLSNFIPSKQLPKRATDLSGRQFHRLTVSSFAGFIASPCGHKSLAWLCLCECGAETIVKSGHLKNGHTKSCGCLAIEAARTINLSHQMSRTPEYRAWRNMHTRCANPNSSQFKDYGGRGIRVCLRWSRFENFLEDLGLRPDADCSIDRIDVNGDYEPTNVRWATKKQQCNNKRSNHLLTFNGRTQTLKEWSLESGIHYSTLRSRLNTYGWSVGLALTTEVAK